MRSPFVTAVLVPVILMSALLGCAGGPAARLSVALYDFGALTGAPLVPALPVARIDVQSPSWLGSPAMQYRLADQPGRRLAFAESRWAAAPSELVEAALRRRVAAAPEGAGCRVRVELDEFVQAFDATGDSRALLAARLSLLGAQGEGSLSATRFALEAPAGRDARSGARAFADLQVTLAGELASWLERLNREIPSLAGRCRG